MKENFLHYVWKFKKFDFFRAQTAAGESVEIFQVGQHNQMHSGPDFFNAKMKIGGQLWAGNVEIHLKSSDWYAHAHQTDPAYDNVILHVVWEHDVEVFRKNNQSVPTLVLQNIVDKNALGNYKDLLESKEKRWIYCARDFHTFTSFELQNWLERLFIERLEDKSVLIFDILQKTTGNWEATLFALLAKNFGLNLNGEAFLDMALSVPFEVVRKMQNTLQTEALFFGQAGMLNGEQESGYFKELRAEYLYLRHKFKLESKPVRVSYFRLRPPNFPTIRLSQLAGLYTRQKNLFSSLIEQGDIEKIRIALHTQTSDFWKTHYTFEKESPQRTKKLTSTFIDLILINTVIPLKFCYFKTRGETNYVFLFEMMRELTGEQNHITEGFNSLRRNTACNALDSQALIQLKKNYCDQSRCLFCQLGLKLLQKSGNY